MMDLEVDLFDVVAQQHCREVMEAILLVVRAGRRQQEPPPGAAAAVDQLHPVVYRWHCLAWRMQGLRRDSRLGATARGLVYVVRHGRVWVGDPQTDAIIEIEPTRPPLALQRPINTHVH